MDDFWCFESLWLYNKNKSKLCQKGSFFSPICPKAAEGFSKSCTLDLRLPHLSFSWTNTTDKSDTMAHTVPQCIPVLSSLAFSHTSFPVYVGGPLWVQLPQRNWNSKDPVIIFFPSFLCPSAGKSNLSLIVTACMLFRKVCLSVD